ncbi:sugar transferase [Marinomonas dokdonensis]|uniref:sugar transferase n=1 Tax=Marinomonas dokdonensis TaxID=328224 RepID=UPI0040557F08
MIRVFDVFFSILGIILLSPIFLILILVCFHENRSPIFQQERLGKDMKVFILYKFRSMPISTPSIATHLIESRSITKLGHFLRASKLDELPQLINVLKGDMSLVGPRPCLPNQIELIEERCKSSIFRVRPGITGLAQINNVDMSTPHCLTELDLALVNNLNLFMYFKYIYSTLLGKGKGDALK